MAENQPSNLTAWFDQNDATRPKCRRAVTRVFRQSFEDVLARFADETARRNADLDASLGLALKNLAEVEDESTTDPVLLDYAFRAALEPVELENGIDHLLDEAFLDAEFNARVDRRLEFHLRSLFLEAEELDSERQISLDRALMRAWDSALMMAEAA